MKTYAGENTLAAFSSIVKGAIAQAGGGSGGTVNWDDINGRPDLSTVSSMVVAPVVLSSTAWSADRKQIAPIEGILADEDAQLIIPLPKSANETEYNAAGVRCVSQAENSLTFRADTVPTVDLSLNVYIFGAAEVKEEQVGQFVWWSPHMTSNTSPTPYVTSQSSQVGNYPAYHAFDGNPATMSHTNNVEDSWIQFDFGDKTETIKGIKFVSAATSSFDYDKAIPKSFTLSGSSDGNSWTSIYESDGSEYESSSPGAAHEYTFGPVSYRYYRVTSKGNYINNHYLVISEIEFLVLTYSKEAAQ